MAASRDIARQAFGSLQQVYDGEQEPQDIFVLEWALNAHRHDLLLRLTHRGALIVVRLYGEDVYGRSVYDTVESAWRDDFKIDDNDMWVGLNERRAEALSLPVVSAEMAVFGAVSLSLPRLLEEAEVRNDAAIAGSQLLVDLKGDLSKQEVTLVGDIFRNVLVDELKPLTNGDYPGIPRVDLSAIVTYKRRFHSHNVIGADILVGGEVKQAVLKTAKVPIVLGNGQDDRLKAQLWLQAELDTTTAIPAHPNVMPSPLALVTVTVPAQSASPAASPGQQSVDRTEKLVGWVQQRFGGFWASQRARSELVTAQRHLHLAVDLCRGVEHLAKHGFYHPDLSSDNTLLRYQDKIETLLVFDFEPISHYNNKSGPDAPEALGQWTVTLDSNGRLHYEEHDKDGMPRLRTIYAELEPMPEARERLLVWNVGCCLARLLDLRLFFPRTNPAAIRPALRTNVLSQPPRPGANPDQDAWEAHFPAAVRELAQRCVAYDPRERPLLFDVVAVMDAASSA